MSTSTVLITGATGFLGSSILLELLRSGHSANIVVRSEAKAAQLQQAPEFLALNKSSSCKYFIVPDLTVAGSLDEAASGANYVIHGASPLPFQLVPPERQHAELIAPAVDCTLGILESARRAKTVRRVVCISSMGGFATAALIGPHYVPPENVYLCEETMNEYIDPPFGDVLTAYSAAKTAALRRSIEWMAAAATVEGGVPFDLVNIAPTYICGYHALATSTAELMATSNSLVLQIAAGTAAEDPDVPPRVEFPGGVHLEDAVVLHIAALDKERIPTPDSGLHRGVENFTLGQHIQWNEVRDIVARKWPDVVAQGLLPNQGSVFCKPTIQYDNSKVEKTFGIRLKGLEEMVDSVVPQYLELLQKERQGQGV